MLRSARGNGTLGNLAARATTWPRTGLFPADGRAGLWASAMSGLGNRLGGDGSEWRDRGRTLARASSALTLSRGELADAWGISE